LNRPRRRKEKAPEKLARAAVILSQLRLHYPDAHCELNHRNAFELLVATILSAQCTDARVNIVTPALFARYPGPAEMAAADPDELEELIRSAGFFRNKRKSLIGMATALVELHEAQVPSRMEALVELPGVGRKTANVILGNAFGINEGIVVDTHVGRLARRLGLTAEEDPVKVEEELIPLFPRESWADLAHLLIAHGRRICLARGPRCGECFLLEWCPTGRELVGGVG
jgi:endonuclease-3